MATIEKRAGKSGTRWRARVRRDGSFVTRTFDSKTRATQWARDQEHAIDRGEWIDHSEAEGTTLVEALDRYASEITPHKKGHRQEHLRIQAWKRVKFARKPLSRIRSTDVAAWRDERIKTVGGQTIRNELALLSHVFKIARTEWGMGGLRNPCEDVRRPPPSQPRERRLREGEEAALLAVADAEWTGLIIMAIETGMRRGELLSLTWDRINLSQGLAHLPETKNGSARTVPLSPRAIEALKALPRRLDGHVFSMSFNDHGNRWRTLCKHAGIEGLTFHDLRHEATSRFVEAGLFNMAEIAAITGHKTMVMLKRYYQPNAAGLAERMRKGARA
ncbi:site-specific integrase [Thioalkalivibrio sp. ALJ15]|uniref:integrase n=1 Tax=Thioalkalivibrio sp. ALJ15 TaxID=748652 RepID=UPI000378C6BE|nr:site-specific integrase [Thioalkalivibrio sp. ALJ15]